jgi:hypothetical protein
VERKESQFKGLLEICIIASQHPVHSLKKDTSIEKKSALVRNYSEASEKRRKRKDSLVVEIKRW